MDQAAVTERLLAAEPVIKFTVARFCYDKGVLEDAEQTARMAVWQAITRNGPDYEYPCNYLAAICRNAVVDAVRAYRGRRLKFDNTDRQEAFNSLPSREPDVEVAVADRQLLELAMASLAASHKPIRVKMFRDYLDGLNQRDIVRKYGFSKGYVCRLIHDMAECAGKVLRRAGAA